MWTLSHISAERHQTQEHPVVQARNIKTKNLMDGHLLKEVLVFPGTKSPGVVVVEVVVVVVE